MHYSRNLLLQLTLMLPTPTLRRISTHTIENASQRLAYSESTLRRNGCSIGQTTTAEGLPAADGTAGGLQNRLAVWMAALGRYVAQP